MIQLLLPNADESQLGRHYAFTLIGFTFVFIFALMYFESEPNIGEHCLLNSTLRARLWVLIHLILSYGLLIIGVSLKAIAYYDDLSEIKKEDKMLLSIGAAVASTSLSTIRLLHKGVIGISERRFGTYTARFAIGFLHGFVGMMSSEVFLVLCLHLALALCTLAIDIASRMKRSAREREQRDDKESELGKKGSDDTATEFI